MRLRLPNDGRAKIIKLSKAAVFRRLIIAFVLLVVEMQFGTRAAQDVISRVVAIADGDTLTVLTTAQQQVRIRLAEIDTPESAQPYGTHARQELSELTFGKGAVASYVEIG